MTVNSPPYQQVLGNMEFVEDESSTYVQLELIAPVRAGEQLFVDYGSSYAYSKHGFARFTGGGVLGQQPVAQRAAAEDSHPCAQAPRIESFRGQTQRQRPSLAGSRLWQCQ